MNVPAGVRLISGAPLKVSSGRALRGNSLFNSVRRMSAPAVNLWSATIFGAAGTVFYLKSFWRETVVPPAP